MTNSDLETRAGLPPDLRYLVEKYPREEWQAHANIHGMASMWLQRHDMFRELGGVLTAAIGDYREGRTTAPEFARFFAPRLNFFLGNLDGHHNVEDQHYFPVFAAAETRLKRSPRPLKLRSRSTTPPECVTAFCVASGMARYCCTRRWPP